MTSDSVCTKSFEKVTIFLVCVEKAGSIQEKITRLVSEILTQNVFKYLWSLTLMYGREWGPLTIEISLFCYFWAQKIKVFCFVFHRPIWVQQYIIETKRQVGPLGKMFKSTGNVTNVAKRIQVYLVAMQTAFFQEALWSMFHSDFWNIRIILKGQSVPEQKWYQWCPNILGQNYEPHFEHPTIESMDTSKCADVLIIVYFVSWANKTLKL